MGRRLLAVLYFFSHFPMFVSKSKNTKKFLKTSNPYIFSSSVSGSQRHVKEPQMRGQ